MGRISKVQAIIMAIIFVASMCLLFWGQSNVGYQGLFAEIVGIIGLVLDLYLYNRNYK